MSKDYIDDIFREKLEHSEKLPKGTNWDKDNAWERFASRKRKTPALLYTLLAAASVTLIIGIALFFFFTNTNRINCISNSSEGTVKEILLKGGHKCFLSAGSKIQYCYSKQLKNSDTLFLSGEAFIETSSTRNLVILAKNTVTNCGVAKANIKAVENDKTTVITSISGKITSRCTENGFPEMDIQPNERCVIFADGIFASKEPNTDPNFMAWKTGTLTFDKTPLKYAIQTIEEYYGVSIEVRSVDLKYCNYTSKFNHSGIDEVIGNIQHAFNVKAEKIKNEIVLEGGECREN